MRIGKGKRGLWREIFIGFFLYSAMAEFRDSIAQFVLFDSYNILVIIRVSEVHSMVFEEIESITELKTQTGTIWDKYHEDGGERFYTKTNVNELNADSPLDDIIDILISHIDENAHICLKIYRDIRNISTKPEVVLDEFRETETYLIENFQDSTWFILCNKCDDKYNCIMFIALNIPGKIVDKRRIHLYY